MTVSPELDSGPDETVTGAEQPWRQLSIRVVHLGLIRLVLSSVTGFAGIALRDDPVWPLVIGAVIGLLRALSDLKRWQSTRYRITAQRVEMRTGWIARKHRIVARDRIRSVDSAAQLLPRLLGLRTVRIGSGESASSFRLDALDRRHAALVQRELMPGHASEPVATAADGSEADVPDTDVPDTVIAGMRRGWVLLNAVSVWAVLAVAGPLLALYWPLKALGFDLLGLGRDLFGWDTRSLAANLGLLLLIGYPLGIAASAVAFAVENWNFRLVRTGTAPDTALVTSKGLLSTQTVQRSDARIRGIAFAEPLLLRWLRLVRTDLLLTGQGGTGEASGGGILPRIRRDEAREIAARILPDGARPLEARLRRHPHGALIRRLGWAVHYPALMSGTLTLFTVSGALPGWVWPLPLLLTPVTVPLALVAYRALGHTVLRDYVVVRGGPLTRRTVALQRRAVIGWTVRQSIFQRRGGRATVVVATSAGERHYTASDVTVDQALALITETTPQLRVSR
ncbi:PH domain-containing protein [Actinoplanes utahensis]|uniref:YdbS-like PH domain-containing protein n=1 Tax=Actinoplanes utahensis TaxID=1869 RepID=A0A0A6UIQ6_ACTUT|nr:PH domain-containing protein [Actinoplanes utahensis]KHD75286.1 hypothetical protein MB27_23785 [Actinoplanes utahensis]GIF30461.1 hypothetical protein Aut01nite_34470 [Actinoplanes utahensis]